MFKPNCNIYIGKAVANTMMQLKKINAQSLILILIEFH
ncbi:MAG: hypothetical protein K0S09_481 [Sphingobacteriaceae bacterium]|jgi:hypothetical protein|nr:hypothetical protein [Sphingobacteriaceae bacterium]